MLHLKFSVAYNAGNHFNSFPPRPSQFIICLLFRNFARIFYIQVHCTPAQTTNFPNFPNTNFSFVARLYGRLYSVIPINRRGRSWNTLAEYWAGTTEERSP